MHVSRVSPAKDLCKAPLPIVLPRLRPALITWFSNFILFFSCWTFCWNFWRTKQILKFQKVLFTFLNSWTSLGLVFLLTSSLSRQELFLLCKPLALKLKVKFGKCIFETMQRYFSKMLLKNVFKLHNLARGSCWIHQFKSEHWSQATLGQGSSWMGDRLCCR